MRTDNETNNKPKGDVLCVFILNGDIGNMTQEQRLSCCRQFLEKMGVVYELPVIAAGRYFPDSLFLTDKGLQQAVANCTNEKALLVLYNDNIQRIDARPQLKQMFTKRKLELRNKQSA